MNLLIGLIVVLVILIIAAYYYNPVVEVHETPEEQKLAFDKLTGVVEHQERYMGQNMGELANLNRKLKPLKNRKLKLGSSTGNENKLLENILNVVDVYKAKIEKLNTNIGLCLEETKYFFFKSSIRQYALTPANRSESFVNYVGDKGQLGHNNIRYFGRDRSIYEPTPPSAAAEYPNMMLYDVKKSKDDRRYLDHTRSLSNLDIDVDQLGHNGNIYPKSDKTIYDPSIKSSISEYPNIPSYKVGITPGKKRYLGHTRSLQMYEFMTSDSYVNGLNAKADAILSRRYVLNKNINVGGVAGGMTMFAMSILDQQEIKLTADLKVADAAIKARLFRLPPTLNNHAKLLELKNKKDKLANALRANRVLSSAILNKTTPHLKLISINDFATIINKNTAIIENNQQKIKLIFEQIYKHLDDLNMVDSSVDSVAYTPASLRKVLNDIAADPILSWPPITEYNTLQKSLEVL